MKPSTPPAPGAAAPRGLRSGMILAFALVILLLMSLMGVVILTSSQTELKITGNTRLGREAFNSADSCARIATFLTLVLVKPKNETIDDLIKDPPASGGPRYPLKIERSATRPFTYEKLLE